MILVLLLWVLAVGLFFHRWGKIRMLEPYTPKFEADEVPLTSLDPILSIGPLASIQCGSTNVFGVSRGTKKIICK